MFMPKCEKCGRTLVECPVCKGGRASNGFFGKLACRTCNSTGYVCPVHEGHWKR
jgi:flavoprotein